MPYDIYSLKVPPELIKYILNRKNYFIAINKVSHSGVSNGFVTIIRGFLKVSFIGKWQPHPVSSAPPSLLFLLWPHQTTLPILWVHYPPIVVNVSQPITTSFDWTPSLYFSKAASFCVIAPYCKLNIIHKAGIWNSFQEAKSVHSFSVQILTDCSLLIRTRNCLGGPDRCSRNQSTTLN